jgi:hypothetical protein
VQIIAPCYGEKEEKGLLNRKEKQPLLSIKGVPFFQRPISAVMGSMEGEGAIWKYKVISWII